MILRQSVEKRREFVEGIQRDNGRAERHRTAQLPIEHPNRHLANATVLQLSFDHCGRARPPGPHHAEHFPVQRVPAVVNSRATKNVGSM